MYTSNFWTIRPWKNVGGKTNATDLDFIIIEQENIEISYNKISPAKYKTSSTNVWPLLQILLIRSVRKDLYNVEDVCQSQM